RRGQTFPGQRRAGDRGGRARGHCRQPVPLHGIHQDRRGHPGGGAMIERIPVTSARSLREAYSVLADRPRGLRVLAGGTDLMVAVNARVGLENIGHILDIWSLAELRLQRAQDGVLSLGALLTYTDLIESPEVRAHF